jgi:hypothetical protein
MVYKRNQNKTKKENNMANKIEEIKNIVTAKTLSNDETGNIFNTWIGSYMAISQMWEESYIRLYRPWLESTNALFEKAVEASNTNSVEKYKEFYNEWTKTFQGRLERSVKIPNLESNKEALEKLLANAEKSTDICRSWVTDLEENSKKTREILQGKPDPVKYKEAYDLWITSYAKIFDGLLTLPFRENVRDMFETYTGMPDIYSDTFVKISKLWNDSYMKLYGSWADTLLNLSKKSEEISKGNVDQDAYKEFYSMWINVYQQTYGKFLDVKSIKNPKEGEEQLKAVFEDFAKSTKICTNLCKSWIATLDKLSEKSKEFSIQTNTTEKHQGTHKEICNLWVKIYQKAFDSIFDNMPVASSFKDTLAPVKDAAELYVETLAKMSDRLTQSVGITNKA